MKLKWNSQLMPQMGKRILSFASGQKWVTGWQWVTGFAILSEVNNNKKTKDKICGPRISRMLDARHWARPWDVNMGGRQAPALRELKAGSCRSQKDKLTRSISPAGCKRRGQNTARNSLCLKLSEKLPVEEAKLGTTGDGKRGGGWRRREHFQGEGTLRTQAWE